MNTLRHLIFLLATVSATAFPAAAQAPFRMVGDYECVAMDKAGLYFPGSDEGYDQVRTKLDTLLSGRSCDFTIWHVGGSHVQAGYLSHALRNNFSFLFPTATRGVLFPFSLAGTNWNRSFDFGVNGEWTTCRNISAEPELDLGLTGFGARTSDPQASFGLDMTKDTVKIWDFNCLRVLGYGSSADAFPVVESRGVEYLPCRTDTVARCYDFILPDKVDRALIKFRIPQDGCFTFQGVIPSRGDHGISYYESGVNGASLPCWLRCRDLGRQLGLIRPDLAILALGINDSSMASSAFDAEVFKERYRTLISIIREASPHCSLLFITNNDSYRYGGRRRAMVHNDNGVTVQKAMMELAREYSCPVWDLFAIMGGSGSVTAWRDEELVGRDKLHFTKAGYQLLADLLYNAMLEDYMAQF
ncbi:MAG: hypothetical protein HUJ94_04560 [Bacteroidales bacterium]|nr:hypothetical protein [Bacteroidales bacterium]